MRTTTRSNNATAPDLAGVRGDRVRAVAEQQDPPVDERRQRLAVEDVVDCPGAGNRRFRPPSALRAHTKAPCETDLPWKTLSVLIHPGKPGRNGAGVARMMAASAGPYSAAWPGAALSSHTAVGCHCAGFTRSSSFVAGIPVRMAGPSSAGAAAAAWNSASIAGGGAAVARPPQTWGSVALSLCATARPLYTRSAKSIGASISEAADPARTGAGLLT